MLFSIIITLVGLGSALAGNYGGYGSYGGYGGYAGSGLSLAGGLTAGLYDAPSSYAHSYEKSYYPSGPLPAAVHSRRTYEVRHVPTVREAPQLTQVDVDAVEQPVSIRFVSRSSPVHIDQVHLPGERGRHQETNSVDEPHRVVHTVTRPVIQEVREIIQPYRRLQQEVRPVLEEINTVVARGQQREHHVQQVAPVAVAQPVAFEAPVHFEAPAPVAVAAPVAFEAPVAVAAPAVAVEHSPVQTFHGFTGHSRFSHVEAPAAIAVGQQTARHIGGQVQSFGY